MAVTMKNSIDEELAGKHIFVTGGTGFMGKVLLEKLLRSCPTLGRIYVLLRPKRGASIQKRLQAIIDTPLFEPLLKVRPEAVSQLHVVAGDCSKLGLGLSPEDKTLLVDNVSYVFHAAATVRFDDPLQSAILLNTRGTQEVVELCKKMKQLKALQYVSTTYCFTNEPVLKEKPYRTDIDWRTMIKIAEREDGYTLAAMTHKILGFQPNTYTFSKALAENIINDARNDIPAVIFRPAVVISSMSEPFPGWLDNLNGPFGIWAAALKGVLRYSYGNADVALSFTPVDWAIRGMIVCAICKGIQSPGLGTKPEEVDVVNMEGSSYERNTFRQQMSSFDTWKPRAMLPIRYPRYIITPCYTYYWLGTVLSQLPYGLVIDILLKLSGQKPRMLSAYRKIFHANEALSYFMLYEFPIETGKSDVLHHCLQTKDRLYFGTYLREDETDMSYELEELKDYVIEGIFKYVFKEEASFESRARRIKMLHALEIVLNIIWCYCMYMTVGKFVISRLPFLS